MSKCKYNEDSNIAELLEYIEATYGEHYMGDGEDSVGLADLFNSSGHASDFYRLTAMKYLYRFGKKNGKNKTDLMKAIHLILFLWDVECPTSPWDSKTTSDKFLENDQS